jgi:mannosyltransferase OCH1-like enzyme
MLPPSTSPEPSIPRIIWQTSRTRQLVEEALGCRDLWLERARGWAYRLMDDEEAREFTHDCYPGEVAATYDAFPLGVMRADFWRVLIVHHCGGLYADTDTVPLAPPSSWVRPDDGLLMAAENDVHLCNWTFAAEPAHPALGQLIELIVSRAAGGINQRYEHFVHHHSGTGHLHGRHPHMARAHVGSPPGPRGSVGCRRTAEGRPHPRCCSVQWRSCQTLLRLGFMA